MKNPQELKWIEELLPTDIIRKPMFGGFAYYFQSKLVLVLFEDPQHSRSYRSLNFDFDLWNGCLFPVEREFHPAAKKNYPYLFSHPILGKWLYLPLQTEDFDDKVQRILKKIWAPESIWGVLPKAKKKKPLGNQKRSKENFEKVDTHRPTMFTRTRPQKTTLSKKNRSAQ